MIVRITKQYKRYKPGTELSVTRAYGQSLIAQGIAEEKDNPTPTPTLDPADFIGIDDEIEITEEE